jgi:transcriptional regulator with XRE-family HTH domain
MTDAGDPTVKRRRLGLELRRGREAIGLTQQGAAQALEWSLSKLIRIESGAQGISVTDLQAMLALYSLTEPDQVAALTAAARGSRSHSWVSPFRDIISPQFATYLGHEGQAASIRVFHPFLVPGLLHTEDYAINLMGPYPDAERAARIIRLRGERQERIFEGTGVKLSFVVGEESLYRWVGGPRVMRRQLEYLAGAGRRSDVSIRVVPFSAGSHPGLRGPFILLRLKETGEELLFLESYSGDQLIRDEPGEIAQYVEFFETLTDLALPLEGGTALLQEQISRLRQAENGAPNT